MKKLLLLSALAFLLSSTSWAYDFTAENNDGVTIYYNILSSEDLTCAVTYKNNYYNSYSGSIIIPETVTYNGTTYTVTSIGGEAFRNCTNPTSVTIPSSVTAIGNYAFMSCTGLTQVTIPESVTEMGMCAFYGCTALTEVNFNATACTSAGSADTRRAFYLCDNISKVTIGDNVTIIPYYLFYGCSNLVDLTLGESLTSIGDQAFYGCTGLTSELFIPNSVTTIGEEAFRGCTGITELAIGESVTTIGASSFRECTGLTQVAIGNSVTEIGSYAFYRCMGLTGILTIPNSVETIGRSAFGVCSGLTSVTIGNSVETIGNDAFSYCTGLTEVTIGNSVTEIGSCAFEGCSGLTDVTIPNSVTAIGSSAFSGCSGLTQVTIGNSVTEIGSYAFYKCTGLTSVTIPCSVTAIGSYAFEGCAAMTQAIMGGNVTTIEERAFIDCTSLAILIIEDGDETLTMTTSSSYTPFTNCPIETLYLGRNLSFSSSSYSVFKNNTALTTLTIGEKVTNIPQYIFYGCTGLTSVSIGNSVTSIGSSAFYGCTGLTSATIPNSVTEIAQYAFYQCTGLTEATIGESVTSIGESAFQGCTGLMEVTLNAITCTSAGSSSNPVFNKCTSINKLIIGENVTTIPAYMFYGCTNLTDIVSYNITPPTYEDNTFQSSILKAEVPKEAIMKYVFEDKWKEIPTIYSIDGGNRYYPVIISYEGEPIVIANGGDENGVALKEGATATISPIAGGQVGGIVQYGVEDVTETINGSGQYSFTVSQYHKINTVYSYSMTADNKYDLTVEQGGDVLNQITVSKINDVYYLKIRGDINGDDISTIRRMPNLMVLDLSDANIVSGGGAYYDTNTTEDNVCGSYCFTDLSNLRCVSLPNSVTSIGQYAFQNCDGLTSMVIPGEVTSIGAYAFTGCTNLTTLFFNGGEGEVDVSASSTKSRNPFNDCPIVSAYVDRKLSYSYVQQGHYDYASPFTNKATLVSVVIGDNATEIGTNEFYECINLTKLTIGNSVETIGSEAFRYCTGLLGNLTIPNSVTTVSSSAFSGCTGLTEVTIPNSVTELGGSAFSGCSGLKTLTLEDGEKTLSTNTSSTPFSNCPIETLYLGRNVRSYAFRDNTSLTTLTIGEKVTNIPQYIFYGCTGLTSVTIPNSVTEIAQYAFYNCTGLTEVTIGNSVETIGSSAFQGCSSLETINSANPTPPDITSSTFSGVDKETCVLNIPTGSLNAYWVHVYWGEFFNINEIDFPDGINEVLGNSGIKAAGYYTLDGKKMPTLQRGINIIHYSDGTAKKVLVK